MKNRIFVLLAFILALGSVYAQQTRVSIKGRQFYINGEPTYANRFWNGKKIEGLLMNSRMVNGIFDDLNPETRQGFKYSDTGVWDPERNTNEFVEAMSSWRDHGLLAFTINLQGGSPMGYGNNGWINSAFEPNGDLNEAYFNRLEKIIDRADELGQVVILGYFYFGADQYLKDESAVINATKNATQWILDKGYENVMVEVANECDIFYDHEILNPEGIPELINMVKSMTKDGRRLLVSTSFSGTVVPTTPVAEASDFILLHGNGADKPKTLRDVIVRTRQRSQAHASKPIIVNEDDHYAYDEAESNLSVSVDEYVSWGLFDFRRKGEAFEEGFQSIPASWAIDTERKKDFFNKIKEITGQGQAPTHFSNPIMPGYHPDPSVCRVGDTYYMVNSSFEWWPAMPIHRSKDLVNWELIGYGGADPNILPIREGIGNSGGIFAVTIRHHDDLFYLITTMIGGGGNFYVTAKDPAGPWSAPVWLPSMGIDPSLFWDDDGRCYYVGHGHPKNKQRTDECAIWMQELDTKAGKLIGEMKFLTPGHSVLASYSEGPHLYKQDGKYILLIAEGGTGQFHAVTQFTSDSLWGPYKANHINPILTHRHLGNDYPIKSVGHADYVKTQNNDYWMVALGTRDFENKKSYLARETFLVPMDFEYTYGQLGIIVNKGEGKVLERDIRPNLPWTPVKKQPSRDEFKDEKLALKWNMLRSPQSPWYNLEDEALVLDLRPQTVNEFTNPSLLAQRLRNTVFDASTRMEFKSKKDNEAAGLVFYRETVGHITLMKQGKDLVLKVRNGDEEQELERVDGVPSELVLYASCDGEDITFSYGAPDATPKVLATKVPLLVVGNCRGGQFNGPMLGVYATSNGKSSKTKATFEWFDYL